MVYLKTDIRSISNWNISQLYRGKLHNICMIAPYVKVHYHISFKALSCVNILLYIKIFITFLAYFLPFFYWAFSCFVLNPGPGRIRFLHGAFRILFQIRIRSSGKCTTWSGQSTQCYRMKFQKLRYLKYNLNEKYANITIF